MTAEVADVILNVLILLALLILVVLQLEEREKTSRLRRTVSVAIAAEPQESREPEAATEPVPAARVSSNRLLVGPPMIGGDTLRDWLIHHHPLRDGVWSQVVSNFYNRAAAVPWVFDYFRKVDMRQLERHFTAQLVILTHTGVTQAMVDDLAEKHADVRNSHGQPITPEVWAAVVDTLVLVLRDAGVPEAALVQLGATIAPLRPVLVTEHAPTSEEDARWG